MHKKRLGQWLATAICGNDITSSCLYVAAIALKQIFPTLNVDFVVKKGKFCPQMVDALSREYGIMKNSMFIGAPEDKHNFPGTIG